MAFQSTVVTTSRTDLVNAWKEVYLPLQEAFNFDCEELQLLESISEVSVDWSTYKTIMPLDIYEGYGAGAVAEGGYKTVPSSSTVVRAEIDVQHYNASFTQSELAQWANAGLSNQVKAQLALQGNQKLNVLKRHLADYIHGTSVGTLALTDTDVSGTSATLVLKSGYGNSAITSAAYIADKFRLGDRIVLVDGTSLVANSFGTITAVTPATPSIAVTFDGTVTVTNNDLKVIKANSKDATTLAAGSDYNRGLVGFQDGFFSTSVHAVSSGSVADWSLARSVSSGGRFNFVKARAMRDAIRNYAPSAYQTPDTLMIDQGVHRDAIAYERAALQYTDANSLTIDGAIKGKGLTIFDSRRVMPGMAAMGSKKSIGKIMLTPMPGAPGAGDGEKLEERSAMRFDLDVVLGTVWKCRKAWAVETGLTTQ